MMTLTAKTRQPLPKQVEEYTRLLQKALRLESTEGYVWYISRGEVVPAKSRQ